MPALSKRALEGLRDYQYKPGGYTVLDELHQPFWNWCVQHVLPPWLAPNLITLIGTFALLVAYVVAAVHLPEFEGEAPRWLYALSGAAALFYLHMDCLDGKQARLGGAGAACLSGRQRRWASCVGGEPASGGGDVRGANGGARRTKNSSPLGQLFDHGCDALALHLILTNIICSFNLPSGWRPAWGSLCCMLPWVLAHWEEYHTGTMVYGNGYIGVTEANYAVVFLHFVAAAIGARNWRRRPLWWLAQQSAARAALPGWALRLLEGLQLNEAFILTICYFALKMSGEQMFRVFRLAGTKQLEHTTLPRRERGHKQLGKAAALQHLGQLMVMFALGALVLLLPADAPGQARVVMGTFGVVYALQATRLIMCHMSKEPFEVAVWPLAAIAFQVANHHLVQLLDPLLLAYAVNAVVVAGYLAYVVSMVNEICAFLQIPCLTVRKVD
eukprot:scaffold12.g8007.t1